MQHWVGGAGLCTSPAPRFTLVTGGAGGLQLHGPAWLSPLIRTTRKSSLSLHLGSLPVFLLSLSLCLSLDDVQPAPWECGGATVAFHRVSDAAGDSGLFLGLPIFQSTIQPFPFCSPWAIVWQAPSVKFPSRSSREKVAQCLSLALYIPKLPGRGSVLLPPQMWPSMAIQSHLMLVSPPRHRSYPWERGEISAENSVSSKPSFPTYFSPRLWLFF